MKYLLTALALLSLMGCQGEDEVCVACMSAAVKLKVLDASGAVILPARIRVLAPDTSLSAVIEDSSAVILGGPGTYGFEAVFADSSTAKLEGIRVHQHPDMTCEHAHTENITIQLDQALRKAAVPAAFHVVERKTQGSCG